MSVTIILGLNEAHRADAARLYWQAFGGKLGPILGPSARALGHLGRVMQLDHCLGALKDGQLVGILGFQGPKGSFAGGTEQDFRASFGRLRAAWGLPLLAWVGGPEARENTLMIDGFSVDLPARGQGIGAALLASVAAYAKQNGYTALQLDVTGSNWRARDFYARHGFSVAHQRSIGPLRLIFGFSHVLRLTRELV
ncbi:MAG: GNAT family N-acetyltransferase [Cypionkella sp.]|nr:GNAT family N-acetyltransferase [Cypionkella sp.]